MLVNDFLLVFLLEWSFLDHVFLFVGDFLLSIADDDSLIGHSTLWDISITKFPSVIGFVSKGLGIYSWSPTGNVSTIYDIRDLSISLSVPRIGEIEVSITFPSPWVSSPTSIFLAMTNGDHSVTNFIPPSSDGHVRNSVPRKMS